MSKMSILKLKYSEKKKREREIYIYIYREQKSTFDIKARLRVFLVQDIPSNFQLV
jgi:hypothetical protein